MRRTKKQAHTFLVNYTVNVERTVKVMINAEVDEDGDAITPDETEVKALLVAGKYEMEEECEEDSSIEIASIEEEEE